MHRLTALRLILVLYAAALAVGTHWPRLQIAAPVDPPFGIDKWLHVGAFAGLSVLVFMSQLVRVRSLRRFAAVLVALAAYAVTDELTQSLVPGRSSELGDAAASCWGVVLGGVAWVIGVALREPGDTFVHDARTMSLLTMVSRVLGLFRDWALAFALGFGWAYDGFVIAFMIPNLFRRLFGEGALAAAFIPRYARLRESDAPAAEYFAASIVATVWRWLLAAAAVICLGAVGVSIWLAGQPWSGVLPAPLTAITIWYMPLVCVLAILGAALQVRRRFFIPSAAPVVLNLAIIAVALAVSPAVLGVGDVAAVHWIAAAVVVAGVAQVLWAGSAAPRIARVGIRPPAVPYEAGRDVDAARRGMFRQWAPMTLALAVFQLNVLADVVIAKLLSGEPGQTFTLLGWSLEYPMRHGAVAVLGATARLYEFPLGVFGIAVAAAIYPALSRASADNDRFAALVRQGLRLTLFIGLPASVGLLLVREPLARTIYYSRGQIESGDAARIAWVLLGYATAVWAYSMNQILTRVFYARDDARTPMRLTLLMVALNLVLNLALVWVPAAGNPMGERLGAAGLAWSTAITAAIQCVILLVLARRHVRRPVDRAVAGGWARTALATAVMAAATATLVNRAPGWLGMDADRFNHVQTALWLAASAGGGAGVFFVVARLMAMAELRWIGSRRDPDPES